MPAKGNPIPRYSAQVKAQILEELKTRLETATNPNEAVSATAAHFVNRDGGGPSTSTIRGWGEAAALIDPPKKRTKSARSSQSSPVRSAADRSHTTPKHTSGDDHHPAPLAVPTEDSTGEPADVDIEAIRAEIAEPLLATIADRDAEIGRLRDNLSETDTDLITQIKSLETELALLRPLAAHLLSKQHS